MIAVTALLALSGCGPTGPGEAGGDDVDPVATLTVLPTPPGMSGAPARAANAGELQRAFTGAPDPELAAKLTERGLKAAAVRSWTGPDGGELVSAISVWNSHLMATGIGGQVAERLLAQPDAKAWTPASLGGTRGARIDRSNGERRLSFAIGPNNIYVRSVGPVDERALVKTVQWLSDVVEAEGGAG